MKNKQISFVFFVVFLFIGLCMSLVLSLGCSPVNFTPSPLQESSVGPTPSNPSPGANPSINQFKPSLVTRSTGCIMCHANITANIITDFGYGGDGKGKNYFFGGNDRASIGGGHAYSDSVSEKQYCEGGNWCTANISGNEIIVPRAPIVGLNMNWGNIHLNTVKTLAEYLKTVLAMNNSSNKNVQVREAQMVFIGAPTEDRIKQVTGVSSGGILYKPSSSMMSFSGISFDSAGYYTNSANPIVCDGDLAIDGILWLNNASVKTNQGCRIYVTKSVFVTGAITFPDSNPTNNIQIVSARMVALGLGRNACAPQDGGLDSIVERLGDVPYDERFTTFFTRNLGDPLTMLAELKIEADTVGKLLDPFCEKTHGRAVGFDHVLFNAPMFQSRYQGVVNGVVISEVTLTSLQSLKYDFDPVFLQVPLLPLLAPEDYFKVEL